MKIDSKILKIAIFATGLSGIVAEYILSTLATYFLGNSVFQWTMIISIMMFSMGFGSRLSKFFSERLLIKFIAIEFVLSILVSFSPLLTYTISAYTNLTGIIIYTLCISIGLLIGMEIPLVIRINDELEELRLNVSSVIEKDYYGSLLGGVFFAFVGLPYLGLTYTPFVLGAVNFLVAILLVKNVFQHFDVKIKRKLVIYGSSVSLLIALGIVFAQPIILHGEQVRYKDKIIFEKQSKYQKIVLTQWKDHNWLYINGNQQLSTLDEFMYHEPLIHPVMRLSKTPYNVLVLGGGDGCAVREILKHKEVKKITLVDLDPVMLDIAQTNPVLTKLNKESLHDPKMNIINQDAFIFAEQTRDFFDVIIIDLPDPRSIELGRLYSLEFYKLCSRLLRPNGFLITQAGSPYYATKSFECINLTLQKAGYETAKMHNQILTMGEWGWVLAAKNFEKNKLTDSLKKLKFDDLDVRWINN
ncbi:MAG: polyamine aminopropyltransferase [Rhodothermaceae bacterium]